MLIIDFKKLIHVIRMLMSVEGQGVIAYFIPFYFKNSNRDLIESLYLVDGRWIPMFGKMHSSVIIICNVYRHNTSATEEQFLQNSL